MFAQPRWSLGSVPCLLAGIIWLHASASLGALASLPILILGTVFLAAGVALLLWPGANAITQTSAFAGFVGALLAVPYAFGVGPVLALVMLATAVAATWSAGYMALQLEPHTPGVPAPERSVALAAKVAVDDLILGWEQWHSAGFALDGTIERVIGEIDECHAFFEGEGYLDKPDTYHVCPPDLLDPEIRRERAAGRDIEVLRFESGYAPADGEPGRTRWMGYDSCRDGWAYVLRHQEEQVDVNDPRPRPWLIATNGYRMGFAGIDVGLFERFHRPVAEGGLGLNVLIPVLPLHGPRRRGWHSGQGFLGIDVIDTLHAEAQAMWDMRRLLSWVRAQGAEKVGATGLSLGGYTTALFASVAEGLDCAIPGIPLTDIPRVVGRHAIPHQMRYAESLGFDFDRIEEVFRVISPLCLEPRVAKENRMIFGATADRLVTPDQVRDLWRHWDEPEIVWYQGTHISFMNEHAVWAGVDGTLARSGVSV